MSEAFEVIGTSDDAHFTLKLHRGDGMTLVAMNWKKGRPPEDFVGFAIEYMEPGGAKFFPLQNRIAFPKLDGSVDPNVLSSRFSPIQKFRWVHFPRNAELKGDFVYRVTPVFMNAQDQLSYGEFQEAKIELRRETYPNQLNVAFTRGFISSQAFVDRFEKFGPVSKLLPASADKGVAFAPTHPKAQAALEWMGFEARTTILELLDEAIADTTAEVRVVAYDLSQREFIDKLKKLKGRLKIIIDDSGDHEPSTSGEAQAENILKNTAGNGNVVRQHMGNLQHNKTIVVSGKVNKAVCGSTNYTWRGFYVQNNNAVIVCGKDTIAPFVEAFENYWKFTQEGTNFSTSASAGLTDLGLQGIDIRIAFSPHSAKNTLLKQIAKDIDGTASSLMYSLAFLSQTPGPIRDAIKKVAANPKFFVYGIANKKVGELQLLKPDGNTSPVFPARLFGKNVPEPFKSEPSTGKGVAMHHKFVVIDFDRPTARVYVGSYNFSGAADGTNGENLLVIKDRRIATSFMIEALRMFDHYHFRVAQNEAKAKRKKFQLRKPPRKHGEEPWWLEDYTNARKVRDRELFA
jgi:phosphatidylserine/phosphatidylglycerophosphate/cardiolipin synthase-like enzyme